MIRGRLNPFNLEAFNARLKLNLLADVDAPPVDNDILQWNSTTGLWETTLTPSGLTSIGTVDLTASGTVQANEFTITPEATSAYEFELDASLPSILSLKNAVGGQSTQLSLHSEDGDGTDAVGLLIAGVGTTIVAEPRERLGIYWDGSSKYIIGTHSASGGTPRALSLHANDNAGQLVLNTDGTINTLSGLTVGDTLDVTDTTTLQETVLEDAVQFSALTGPSGLYITSSEFVTTTPPTSGVIGYWTSDGSTLEPTSALDVELGGDLAVDDYVGIGTAAVDGERLTVLLSATDTCGINVDGNADPFLNPSEANLLRFNQISRTVGGTPVRYPAVGEGTRIDLTVDTAYSGSSGTGGSFFKSKSWTAMAGTLFVDDSMEITTGGAITDLKYNAAQFITLYDDIWTQSYTGVARNNTVFVTGGEFTSSNRKDYTITDGTLVVEFRGGVFTADSLSPTYLTGTPTINYVGGDFIATGETDSDSTSIAGRFSATGSDTNIAIQVEAGTSELKDTNIGDGTNETQFSATGDMSFAGTATVWDDYVVPLTRALFGGSSNDPTLTKIADDGAGSAGVWAFVFGDGDEVLATVQMPHSWKEGSTIYPHVHLFTMTDVDPSDNFDLEIEYWWADIDEDFPANTTLVNTEHATGVNSQYLHQYIELTPAGIDGTGHTISSVLMIRIERVAAAGDNYGGGIAIMDFDIHFEKDTVGSRTEEAK